MNKTVVPLSSESRDRAIWISVDVSDWADVARQLSDGGYSRGEWLTAVHEAEGTFTVTLCVSQDGIVQTFVSCSVDSVINSISEIYPSLDFHEREVQQMFGIKFINSRGESPAFAAEFLGFPLRRAFALESRVNQAWPGQVDPEKSTKQKLPPGVSKEWIK